MVDLGLGSRACAEPLHSSACLGRPGVRGDLRGGRAMSWADPCYDFWLQVPEPTAYVAGWLACGLSSPKRNPGSWSDFLRDVALYKAELRLKPSLHKVQTAKQGSFGGSVGEKGGFPSHVSHRLQALGPATSPPQAPTPSVWLGAAQFPNQYQGAF